MGSELSTKVKPGLAYNRYITGYIAGTASIYSIEIIRNGSVIHTIYPKQSNVDFSYDDSDMIGQIALAAADEAPPFIYYYLRITQEDGHIAWSSPIWIDIYDIVIQAPPKKSKKKS